MSKNFELMQQAGIGIGGTATLTGTSVGVAARTDKETVTESAIALAPSIREESYKLVQTLFLTPPSSIKSAIFAAIDSGNGCSRLCAIAAQSLAENVSGSVCLLEGNFRNPTLPEIFGADQDSGLTDCLTQEGAVQQFAKPIVRNNLWLLSGGSHAKSSVSLLNSGRMKERMAELRSAFDYVLIDGPPLNAYADSMVLGRLVDGIVLVLEANATRRETALRIAESLRSAKIPVLGAVLNNRTFPIPAVLYKRL